MLQAELPHEPFNTLVRDGTAGPIIRRILDDIKPEAVYFTELDGLRTAVLIVDIQDASQLPALTEPFFLQFEADCRFRLVMSPEDLHKSGIEGLGQKWA
jgi:hypothetical protein